MGKCGPRTKRPQIKNEDMINRKNDEGKLEIELNGRTISFTIPLE